MSTIHYFQRYSSLENAVTNNTLQLFARIYDYSPSHAARLLTELTGEQIEIGIEIHQQGRTGSAIPDGAIIQRGFKILIESKVNAPMDAEQLLRHASTFKGESQRILLLLMTREAGPSEIEEISKRIARDHPGVIFKSITYHAICTAIKDLFENYEAEMQSLVQDYIAYCNDTGLSDQSQHLMRISPCGDSYELNEKYGIYFHPSDRGYTKHSFAGMYTQKSVRCLWLIESVFDVSFDGRSLARTTVQGRDTADYDKKIIAMIQEAKDICGYDIRLGHRFFCGKEVFRTNYIKSSAYGIQGARFVNLQEEVGEYADARDVALKLDSKTWE